MASFIGMKRPVSALLAFFTVFDMLRVFIRFTPPEVMGHHLVHFVAGAITILNCKVQNDVHYYWSIFPNWCCSQR